MDTLIVNARLIMPDRILDNAWLLVRGGVIEDYGIGPPPDRRFEREIDARGNYLSPGFVDTHVHGGGGHDFRDGTEEAILGVLRTHLRGGTTTILPTLTSLTHHRYLECLDAFGAMLKKLPEMKAVPDVAGIHMEGPYCTGAVLGAQNTATYRLYNLAEVEAYLEKAPFIRKWTAASELDGGLEFGKYLEQRGIVASIGHSNATLQEVYQAYSSGYSHITHLYSACSSYRRNGAYREAGIVEAAYLIDKMDVEMIADGVHLPPEFMQLIFKIKGPEHTAMVTDASRWAGVEIAEGELVYSDTAKEFPIYIENGVALVKDRSCFAGSIALANRLVRSATKLAGIALVDAVKMVTLTPARILGLDKQIGSIQRGKRANLLLFDDSIEIGHILVGGELVS